MKTYLTAIITDKCYTLSDISTGIGVSETFISSLGLSQSPATSTMSNGNKNRSYIMFESLYHGPLTHYAHLLSKRHESHIIKEIKDHSIKLIDSTGIIVYAYPCLTGQSLLVHFIVLKELMICFAIRTAKGGIKIHTCWDDTMMIPDVIKTMGH